MEKKIPIYYILEYNKNIESNNTHVHLPNNTNIESNIESNDKRILDFFTNNELKLPDNFFLNNINGKSYINEENVNENYNNNLYANIFPKNIMLAAGDGWGCIDSKNKGKKINYGVINEKLFSSNKRPTNIEAMTKGKCDNINYDIFCCHPTYWHNQYGNIPKDLNALKENIMYMKKHKELNIVLCLMDIYNTMHINKFIELFKGKIGVINTDYQSVFFNAITAYTLLNNMYGDRICKISGPIKLSYNSYFYWDNNNKYYIAKNAK